MVSNCILFGDVCKKETHESYEAVYKKYAKVVWCRDTKCAWNLAMEEKRAIKHHIGDNPLPNDTYPGICMRPELGMDTKVVDTFQTHHVFTTCNYRSDKSLSGHVDFAKLISQNKNTNIPDPQNAGANYVVDTNKMEW